MSSGYVITDRLDSVLENLANLQTTNSQKLADLENQLEYISGQLKTVTSNQSSMLSKTYNVKIIEE